MPFRTVLSCVVGAALVLAGGARPARADELPRSAFIGVAAGPVTDDIRQSLHLPGGPGVLVNKVIAGGSGEAIGIVANDVLTQIDDHSFNAPADLIATVKRLRAGDNATIHYIRNGHEEVKKVRLKPRPYEAAPGVDTQYLAVTVDGSLRRVIVTKPKGDARHPAVLYLNGVGCFSQESADLSTPDAKLL